MFSLVKSRLSGKTLFFIFIACFLSSFLHTIIINVPADQPTIQAGITAAANTDTVLVQPGTYLENINYNGKLITVGSLFLTTQDTTYISSTIIDGNSSGSVVIFESSEDTTAVLCGFTITNGLGLVGGIYCHNSNPVISHCVISHCEGSWGGGGGVFIHSCDPLLSHCTISNNSAPKGGGISSNAFNGSILDCIVSGNTADTGEGRGGGIFLYDSSWVSLTDCVISDNYALNGGGIFIISSSAAFLTGCTFLNNEAGDWDTGGAVHCISGTYDFSYCTFSGGFGTGAGAIYLAANATVDHCTFNELNSLNSAADIYVAGGSVSVSNCIHSNIGTWSSYALYGVGDITYSDFYGNCNSIIGGPVGFGELTTVNANGDSCDVYNNIFMDPLFVDPDTNDFHLLENSPCIDAGDPAFAYDPDDTITDMGAYFYYQPPDTDFTADITNGYTPLTVNFTDLSTGVIDEWYWDFGDGNNSSLQDPAHEYYNRGSYTVSLTVTDVNDSTDTETKVDYITVLNSTPIVQNSITDFSFDEDTVDSSIDLNIVFDDADLPYGDVLSFFYSGNTYIDVSIVSGIVTLTPAPDWFGYEDITFTATDDSLASVSDEVRITIDPVNDAPVINSYDPSYSPVTIDETDSQIFWVSAFDIDGDPLSYQWYVDDVPQTGQTDSTYTHTTDYTSAGTYLIKCIVDDGVAERIFDFSRVSRVEKANKINLDSEENRATDHQEWQLIVNDSDQVIVVNDIQPVPGPVIIDEMETIDFFFSGNDPDGNPLVYSWIIDGDEVSTDSTYTFETDYTSAGEYEVTLFVTDNFGTRDELNFLWNVTVNDVSGTPGIIIPVITKLYNNHPNPFNPVTNIQFDIKEHENGILTIFNIKGQLIESHKFVSGKHNYLWDAAGQASGIYLYKLQTQTMTETRKMLLLK